MLLLSNRGLVKMPNGEPAYLDLDTFADQIYQRTEDGEWSPVDLEGLGSIRRITLAFSGYNNRRKIWADDAISGARDLDSLFPLANVAAALWPCRGENLIQTVQFHKARLNAARSALEFYAPLVATIITRGIQVSVIGHSCGGYLAALLAGEIAKGGQRLHSVILMEAAMRCSEFSTIMLAGAHQWLCFHSADDNALEVMQRDPVDEAGGRWAAIARYITGRNERREPIVGMRGIPFSDPCVTNSDLTATVGDEHSADHCVPWVRAKVLEVLG